MQGSDSQQSANQRAGIAWPSLSEYNTTSLTEKLCPAEMKKIFKYFLTPPLYGTLLVPYVPVRVTRGALVAHRYTYAPPRCGTSQYCRTFIPLSVSLWNDLAGPVFDDVGLMGFKSSPMAFYWPSYSLHFLSSLLSLSSLFIWAGFVGLRSSD